MKPKPHDRILVDTGQYDLAGPHWCEVVEVKETTGALFPIKVQVPGKGIGQYRHEEIMDIHPGRKR